jgi:hypothetical protein
MLFSKILTFPHTHNATRDAARLHFAVCAAQDRR